MTLRETAPITPSESVRPPDTADVFVNQLVAGGVTALYINSGTDTFPIQEAIAKRLYYGERAPRVVLCLDEVVAGAAAHGHFMVTNQPQAVLVHVDVGTQQLGGSVHNAQRGRAGMLLCAGRAPVTLDPAVPGARSHMIHWIQEQLDQNGIVRGYTKWDYELRRADTTHLVVQRALQVAASDPAGPVYLTLPRELLMEPVATVPTADPARFAPSRPGAPRPDQLDAAARALANAQSPLLIAGRSGRNPAAVAALVALAELLGAPVASIGDRMSFPTTHPLYADGNDASHLVGDADVILVIDAECPYIPSRGQPAPSATLIQIDSDPLYATIPLMGYPYDISMQADSAIALDQLTAALRPLLAGRAVSLAERRAAVEAANRQRFATYREMALSRASQAPIHPYWAVHTISEALDESWTVVDESVGALPWTARYLRCSQPGSYYKSGGSSLGWALGAALGAKIAQPDRTVAAIVGDGTFVYGCPEASLWAAHVEQAPFLTLILNNGMHNATAHALRLGYPNSYAERTGTWPGIRIDRAPDYAGIARACAAHGETVDRPEDLRPALARACERVMGGQAAVVDIRVTAAR